MKKVKKIVLSLILLVTLVVCLNFNNNPAILGDDPEILEPMPLPWDPVN